MDLLVTGMTPPSERDFALFQRLIHEQAGICLTEGKRDLLVARLQKRLRALGVPSFKAYYARVVDDTDERTRMLDCISTNETHFFREPQQLAFLSEHLLPRLKREAADGRREKRVRVWSAGCATGEEPYTLAMILRHQLAAEDGWQIEILATDLSSRAIERGAQGCYPFARAAEIPERHLKAYMRKGVRSREGWISVGPAIRGLVRFERHNLCAQTYPAGPFDLVACRNVLIYFDSETRARVVGLLVDRLSPGGLLLLGHAESLTGSRHGLRCAGPLSYGRPGEGAW